MKEIAQQKFPEIKVQRKDSELNEMILYLETDQLRVPEDAVKAKKIALESSQCEIFDRILYMYHNTPTQPGTWYMYVVVPKDLRTDLLTEAHSGKFSGHFAELRVYDLLRCRCWWKGMHMT